ncbi:MAG: NitT/TauT family transport system substrate-binding protein [Verrucomicrobiales bacterium]|nr:NitT/TauT family transport system substrate-binding protein [Verrucomicrobiales bacterium]
MNRRSFLKIAPVGLSAGLVSCSKESGTGAANAPIRFGHFPNITHVQALVAHNLSRQGKGWFEERLGVTIDWYTYNAGPSAIEAIFAKSLDVTYIGPSPVLNGFAKSKGTEIRILAGAANGGTALIVRPGAGIEKPEDFRGKKVATPQLGNTQDVQLRAWLVEHGFQVSQTGGDVIVLPTQNADQLGLFTSGGIDAVWTAEPWASRLELEAGGKVFLEDKDTNVTLLAARAGFLKERTELAKKLAAAHRELTDWVIAHPNDTRTLIKEELKALTGAAPGDELLNKALARTILTNEISRPSLDRMVVSAQKAGFLKDIPALDSLLPSL